MKDGILIIPILVSFFLTLSLIPLWIKRAKEEGLVGKDMNKFHDSEVAEGGGITVVAGFLIGVLSYIALKTFYFENSENLIEIFALLGIILISAGIGLIDTILGWKKGLGRRFRILLVIFASIPLIVINAGHETVTLPLLGKISLGILYPLVIIPIGVVGATTTFNFLAGFNGLEAGQGIILLSALSLVSYLTGSSWLAVISLCMALSLVAFLFYNFYPAKVFPGDTLTYSVGALIATISILGSFEKIAIFFFIPYIFETILKSRGKLSKQSFGKPNADGTLDLKYSGIYSLNHLSIYLLRKFKINPTEIKVVISIWIFQILIVLIGLIIFWGGLVRQ